VLIGAGQRQRIRRHCDKSVSKPRIGSAHPRPPIDI
jgi:hypothetical protein